MPDDHEEERALKLEFQWLLQDETPYILAQLKDILKACLQKFTGTSSGGSVYRANNYLLALPNSDAVRGIISIAGDSVIKADLKFKIPKLSHGSFEALSPWKLRQNTMNLAQWSTLLVRNIPIPSEYNDRLSNFYLLLFIQNTMNFAQTLLQEYNELCSNFVTSQCIVMQNIDWSVAKLQDANNHLQIALEDVYEREACGLFHSGQEVSQLMSSIMASLSKGKSCLIVPGKKSLCELMVNGQQRVLNPALPEEVLVNFHINCDKLVFSLFFLNNLTTAPSHMKNLPSDPSHIGHVFECHSKWYEVINRIEIVSTVPWLKEIIVLFNTAQQLCQQLKDKINMFHNLLPSLDLNQLDVR